MSVKPGTKKASVTAMVDKRSPSPVQQQEPNSCRPFYALPPSNFSPQVAITLDRMFNAYVAGLTGGTDPKVVPLALLDWWVKLAWSPGTHARLSEKPYAR